MSTAPIVRSPANAGSWRPPQWNKPATVMVTVPASAGSSSSVPIVPIGQTASTDANGNFRISTGVVLSSTASLPTSYVFDAVLALEHDQTLTKTRHPVQTGSSVSSHAYIEPATVVLYVLMSDVATQYTPTSQTASPYIQVWTGNPSKSVAAYQTMLAVQARRVPLTVSTRLRTYYNMLITKISPREDDKTITGSRFRLEFEQLFIASTQVVPLSARPNDTASTGLGAVNTQPPSTAVQNQFGKSASGSVQVPGAGDYSSVVQQAGISTLAATMTSTFLGMF